MCGSEKKAEYDKQCRMKRKFLLQQQASTSSETELVQKQKKAEYNKQYRLKRCKCNSRLPLLTYDMYKPSLRHIHDPVLSSLKMKGIRILCILLSSTAI
jgi:hypothetical protein